MTSKNLPAPRPSNSYTEAGVPLAAFNSGGLRCGGCGEANIQDDWMIFSVECSPGPRDNRFSTVPTVTGGFLLCLDCFHSPGGAILRNAVSDTYARPAPKHYGCVTLCIKPTRIYDPRGRYKSRKRKTVKCPACFSDSAVYRINHDETPTLLARLAIILRGHK